MSDHNHVGCQGPMSQRCEDRSDGYRCGKSKALFEVSTRTTDHPPGCACDPMPGGGGAASTSRRRRGVATPGRGLDVGT